MRSTLLILYSLSFFSTCLAVVVPKAPPPLKSPEEEVHADAATACKYLIKLKNKDNMAKVSSFISDQTASASSAKLASIASVQGVAEDAVAYGVAREYTGGVYDGFSATLTAADVDKINEVHADDIEYIEKDGMVYAQGVTLNNPPSWGQVRVATWQKNLQLNTVQFPQPAGRGVAVYVLDTGIVPNHPSFGGRATQWRNYVREEGPNDGNGHGTHVAGTIASSKYGIATNAHVYGVKVLNSQGTGMFSRILAALDDIAKEAKPCKTVVNLSLSGGYSKSINDAMANARAKGILVVVAAGNDGKDACQRSPASSVHVLTVGATDANDAQTSYSNWGKCVDVFAPGSAITSLSYQGTHDEPRVLSGTSMAAPHVAAVAAIFMSMKQYRSVDEVTKDLLGWSHECVQQTHPGSSTGLVFANPPRL